MDTIAAIATAAHVSAIGVLRLSGAQTPAIVDALFTEQSSRKTADFTPRKLYYGTLKDEKGNTLDRCLCTISHAPNSYTGEYTAEFQCHGSPALLHAVLAACFSLGARAAHPGEFTKRAFLNGKLDLIQAEAVADLIHAETIGEIQNAAGQLGGAISTQIEDIHQKLTDILAHFHAVVDYYDEDIEDFKLSDYQDTIQESLDHVRRLLSTCERGQILSKGILTAIIGRPNVGKSSLLNMLLGYCRAIVTEIAGTTRDTLEERVVIGDTLLRLTDTAGLRETDDPVESIGVEKAKEAAQNAKLLLFVFDGSSNFTENDQKIIMQHTAAARKIAIVNKCDLAQKLDMTLLSPHFEHIISLSAKDGTGLEDLEHVITTLFATDVIPQGEILINPRQISALEQAKQALDSVLQDIDIGITPDAILTELEAAVCAFGELTGRLIREDVVARIFERFCVGK